MTTRQTHRMSPCAPTRNCSQADTCARCRLNHEPRDRAIDASVTIERIGFCALYLDKRTVNLNALAGAH